MRTRIDAARLRTRPIWLIAAATCFIPTVLLSDASLQPADARMMMGERPMMGHASRMDGGRMHGGGRGMHGHRGGGFRGFGGGSAVGLGLAIGGMVVDQMQRQQARDDDEPRDVPARRYVDKPSSKTSTSVSRPKKKDPPSVARKNKDEPVYAKKNGERVYAKKQDTPYSSQKKDEPRSGRADEPMPTSTTTREPGLKPPPEYPTGRPPLTPSLVPPSTPLLVSNPVPVFPAPPPPAVRCEDCRELWLEIKRYEKQIEADEKKLAKAEKKLERRKQQRDELEAKIRKARGPLKEELEKHLRIVKDDIDWLTTWNDELRDIINEEKELKAKLEEAYNKCADPQCREKTADTPEAPKEPEPAPEQPKDTPVTSAPPPQTPVVFSPPQPTPASTPASGPCVDHWAELTNAKRVFHRIYIQGAPRETFILGSIEQASWNSQLAKMQSTLEGPGRQDPNSTTKTLKQPSWKAMMEEFEKLQARAQPCEEITIIVQAHGFFDKFASGWEGSVQLNGNGDPLTSGRLAKVVKGFRPDVSVTVFMDSCEGGGFGGEGGIEQSQLVQVIGNSEVCPSLDAPFREELFEEFINGIDNAANGGRDGRTTAREVKSHLVRSGWPIGSPLDY